MKLHEHERVHLECTGKVMLWRPVEPQPPLDYLYPVELLPCEWQWSSSSSDDDMAEWWPSYFETAQCSLGTPGDLVTIESHRVRIVSVEVRRVKSVTCEDARATGLSHTFPEMDKALFLDRWYEHCSDTPWKIAWAWVIEIEMAKRMMICAGADECDDMECSERNAHEYDEYKCSFVCYSGVRRSRCVPFKPVKPVEEQMICDHVATCKSRCIGHNRPHSYREDCDQACFDGVLCVPVEPHLDPPELDLEAFRKRLSIGCTSRKRRSDARALIAKVERLKGNLVAERSHAKAVAKSKMYWRRQAGELKDDYQELGCIHTDLVERFTKLLKAAEEFSVEHFATFSIYEYFLVDPEDADKFRVAIKCAKGEVCE